MTWLDGSNPDGRGMVKVGGALARFALVVCLGVVPAMGAAQVAGQPPAAAATAARPAVAHKLPAHPPEAGQQLFTSAAGAARGLFSALQKDDPQALLKVLGASAEDIISSGDDTEDKNDRTLFVQKYMQMHRLLTEADGLTTLYIGSENWPTPIPLVHRGASWYFDTEAGRKEILYRRVGENELTVIHVCMELADAQKEYEEQPRDGGSLRQYAQKIMSDPGKRDGLYWQGGPGEAESPLGPFMAAAEAEGYAENANLPHQPFHGYFFRVLKGQGASAPGGARSYIVDGKMTGGFAFLAYPAEYRASGVMTFMVGQDGVVYQKDLGRQTDELVKSLRQYNPDTTWKKAD